MKIEGPSKTGVAGKTGKTEKTQKGDSRFGDMVADAAGGVDGVNAIPVVARVDALLAVQSVDSIGQQGARRRAYQRGDKILQQLDELKLSLLSGTLTIGQVIDIADVVASHREKISDPHMTALLDEIDLRAQIEMAKIRKSLEKTLEKR